MVRQDRISEGRGLPETLPFVTKIITKTLLYPVLSLFYIENLFTGDF
jgi:hypothetical protein